VPHRLLLGSNPRATIRRVAALIGTAVLVFGFVLLPLRLEGVSMLPTYRSGAFTFANRLAYLMREPARGDVVAIRMAGPGVVLVKRIVGLPGEQIEIAAGVVLVNGTPLAEPAVAERAPWNLSPFRLAADEYFVIGDNRRMPIEQHDLGRVARDRIIGRLVF
jgi:signal peptidase I